ncbi:response regulator transcription factor [Lysobacter sp. A6]|uniref:Response regulator transcription factor n=1 Tax=Noviluteimonas lactosilytica TaxID=2888523 RepID=A0ABS8JLM0_9GAMM|nr:response regulator transcription factor [Lysobacter lactosilyticus]
MRIALVEDHARLAELIRIAFARAGFGIDAYDTLASARYWLCRNAYGALVLDRGMPDGDGLSLIAALRGEGWSVPCLVLTARDAIHDRVEGLEHGADDYLAKPFAIEELVARVRALMRRPATLASMHHAVGKLQVDADTARVFVDGVPLRLAPSEYRLLLALAQARGATRTHAQLLDAVFGPFSGTSRNALEVAVHRLRARLREHDARAAIVNERRMGFALVATD